MFYHQLKILKDLSLFEEFQHIQNHDFFTDRLLIHSPLYLPDIEKGISFLNEALKNNQKIFIFGDRDVDGITSTVILYDFITILKPNVQIVLKNSKDGDYYGIHRQIIEEIFTTESECIFFLDMGSSHIQYLKDLVNFKKKIIILDHHIPQIENIPQDYFLQIALINPLLQKIVLEHSNRISTSGITLKFILGYLLNESKALQKLQSISYSEKNYYFQNGLFLGMNLENQPGTQLSFFDFRKHFSLDEDFFQDLVLKKPIEIGKYITALSIEMRENILNFAKRYSTLAAIGMLADQIPLVGENRTIIKLGLGTLKYKPNLIEGLKALFQEINVNFGFLNSRDISWTIAPLLNAAGRMGETEKALDVLVEKNPMKALQKAKILSNLNSLRKERTKRNQQILENNEHTIDQNQNFIFFYHKEAEPGVSGIMASRMAEKFKKPAIWINPEGEYAKGSIRSWGGVNVLEMLLPIKNLFVDLGGHAEAAGFTITYENIEKLKEEIFKISQKFHSGLNEAFLREQSPYFEYSIKPEQLGDELISDLRKLEPFGNGNPEILFLLKSVRICDLEIFLEKHIKFKVVRALSTIEFIHWKFFEEFSDSKNDLESLKHFRWDIIGTFERNPYFPSFTNSKFRFYVKKMNKQENLDNKLNVILNRTF